MGEVLDNEGQRLRLTAVNYILAMAYDKRNLNDYYAENFLDSHPTILYVIHTFS